MSFRLLMSDHLRLEIAAAHQRGRPLGPSEPVPGCPCPTCTGLPLDHPARVPAWRQADPEGAAASDHERVERWARRVEEARSLGIIEIAARLGCGDPVRRGRELAVRCPLHEDSDPSCRLDSAAGVWYCDPCAEGGDAIELYKRARRLTFTEAVRELAGGRFRMSTPTRTTNGRDLVR